MSGPDGARAGADTQGAINTFNDGDHILGVWFVAFEAVGDWRPSDILATLFRRKADDRLIFSLRIRWDAGTDDMTDDRKRGQYADVTADGGKLATAKGHAIMGDLVAMHPGRAVVPLEYHRIAGGVDRLLAKLGDRPWFHVSRGTGGN